MSENRGGDSLARGAARFTFKPAGSKVSQARWNEIFGVTDKDAGGTKRKKKSKR